MERGSAKAANRDAIVFVVDDDGVMRSSIENLIRSSGLRVRPFACAEDFWRAVGQRRQALDSPACVVLDVRLPGISGLDLQQRMAESGINIPIIFVTGDGNIPMGVQAMKAGAVNFLTKPFADQDFIAAVREGIERNRTATQTSPRKAEANGSSRPATQEDLNRLAGELHDGLTQTLCAISMQLSAAKLLSARGGDPLCKIDQAIDLANVGLVETRRCAHNLRSSAVEESVLKAELQRLAERWNVGDRWYCQFQSDNIPEPRVPNRAKHQLLRIAQEAVHNAARHANPTLILLSLRWRAPNLVLRVTDNGDGIPAGRLEKGEGFGLSNMRQRAKGIDGRLEIRTAVGRGTTILVTVPIP